VSLETLNAYVAMLAGRGIRAGALDTLSLAPAARLPLHAADWGAAGAAAVESGWRFAGIWGDPHPDRVVVFACLEQAGRHLVLETPVPLNSPALASFTPAFPGADRPERHLRDLLGVELTDHPDDRRWTRHRAWPNGEHPLRVAYPAAGRQGGRTRADADYPFTRVEGAGVYEIPVGPVHAGIIEPGHFRFQAVGEEVLRLEERLGYVHKGIEKIAVDRDPAGLARLAGRVSGDSTVAHAWAACQAMERASGCEVPVRALEIRAVMAERERIANHLGDIGAICNDVGFAWPHVQCAALREQWQRRSRELFGHRLMMDTVIPGGVAADLDADGVAVLKADHAALRRAVEPVFAVIDDYPSLEDRLQDTGVLAGEDARALGCTGYVGKASGLAFDARLDSPYYPYDRLDVTVPCHAAGDVAARVRVRMQEILASLELMERLLDTLSPGSVAEVFPAPAPQASGLGLVEGWRGEILSYVRFGESGRIARFFPRDPSWFTWPALERLIHGNIVPDFPVCNKSVNGSYSGHDL
jgi:Ni,Fe-hydrogenase III large subunit/NADH:ubiquinone oxidoreductase subunit C